MPGAGDSIELRQLRYFVAVADERHFGRAAERLGIAQPGLSQQIQVLERTLQVRLFARNTRGVELTAAGEALLHHARLILELANRAMDSARLASEGKKGLLRLGTSLTGMHGVANHVLAAFRERFAEVEVEIHPGFGPRSLEALERRFIDVAFVLSPFDPVEGLRYRYLGGAELLVALPQGHRLAALDRIPRAELLKEPFLDWPRSINPPLVDHIHELIFGDEEHPRLVEVAEVGEAARLVLVAEGRGIGIVSIPEVAELQISGIAFRRLEQPAVLEYGMAWFDDHASPYVPAFVCLADEFADLGSPEDPRHRAISRSNRSGLGTG